MAAISTISFRRKQKLNATSLTSPIISIINSNSSFKSSSAGMANIRVKLLKQTANEIARLLSIALQKSYAKRVVFLICYIMYF